MSEHEHCWHSTGVLLTSDPPKTEYRCCHCGEKKYVTEWFEGPDPSKHGPYLRMDPYKPA